jgi:putative inorganic carbon (HCO3(-)) transporter
LAGRVENEEGARTAQFTLADRIAVWHVAWAMISDFPLTGIGLGMFPTVGRALYQSRGFYGWGSIDEIPHAHNLLLQVAVDVGLPGFAFFVLLTIGIAVAAHRAYARSQSRRVRALVAAAACGLFAYYVYGLTDAIGLGEKPGIMSWILVTIVAACAGLPRHQMVRARPAGTGTVPARLSSARPRPSAFRAAR